jgi:type I restriction enzyme, S subunit
VDNGKFLAVSAAGADGLIDHYEHEADVPVLSAIGAQCGRMFYPGERFTAIKNTITLTPKEGMADGKFLYYLFTHVELPQRGAGQPFISKGDIEAFRVSIPESLEEQRKIVEKLDSAFAEIDLLETNLEKSVENTNDLFQSIQNATLTTLDEGWKSCKIGDLGKWITGSTPSTAEKEFWGDEVPFVTPADLGSGGELGEIGRRISKLGSEQVRIVIPPSVLLVCIGATLGKVAWTNETITTNQQINSLKVDDKKFNTKFIMYLLSSPSFQKRLWDSSTGTTVPIINKRNLESIEISVPALERQIEIANKLDNTLAEIEILKASFKMDKSYAAALHQSLLSSAFSQEEAVA